MKVLDNGLLFRNNDGDPKIEQVPSPRNFALAVGAPVGVCWHYSAGMTPNDIALVKGEIGKLNPKNMKSWHLWLTQEGPIIQSVSFLRGAWHVRKTAPKTPEWAKGGINRWLIGIEIESVDGKSFTNAQKFAADRLIGALRAWRPNWELGAFEWGHTDFDPPPRRFDPGPLWRESVLPALLSKHFIG